MSNKVKLISLVLLLSVSCFAFITPGGYYGYSYTPLPTSINKGEIGYAARFDFIGSSSVHHSVVMRPLSFMELGLGINKNPIPAAKIIFPLYDSLNQHAALGFSGRQLYFTGMLNWLTIAGIYDTKKKISIGSVAAELELNYAAFSIENFWYKNKYGATATFTLRPFAIFDVPSFLEASSGISWRSPEYSKTYSAYISVQAKAPLLETDKEPIVYIDINPTFDYSVSFARNVYPLRVGFDMDAVLTVPFDFYLIGALSPYIKTENQARLPKRDMLDRYYLLWDSEKYLIWAACGMLNTDIYGCQTQVAKNFYNTLSLTLGYTKGDQEGVNATGQIPLHPKLSGSLSRSLLFAEGGFFLGEKLAAQLNFRQGTDKKYFQIGSGYDFERKSIYGELSFNYDFSISTKISGMAIRIAPNSSHRINSDLYVFDYDVPIYQEGNNARRLHNFPWKK